MSDHEKETLYPKHPEEPRLTEADVRRLALEIARDVVRVERDRVAASVRKVIDAAINSPNMSRVEQDELVTLVIGEIFQREDMAKDLADLLRKGV